MYVWLIAIPVIQKWLGLVCTFKRCKCLFQKRVKPDEIFSKIHIHTIVLKHSVSHLSCKCFRFTWFQNCKYVNTIPTSWFEIKSKNVFLSFLQWPNCIAGVLCNIVDGYILSILPIRSHASDNNILHVFLIKSVFVSRDGWILKIATVTDKNYEIPSNTWRYYQINMFGKIRNHHCSIMKVCKRNKLRLHCVILIFNKLKIFY